MRCMQVVAAMESAPVAGSWAAAGPTSLKVRDTVHVAAVSGSSTALATSAYSITSSLLERTGSPYTEGRSSPVLSRASSGTSDGTQSVIGGAGAGGRLSAASDRAVSAASTTAPPGGGQQPPANNGQHQPLTEPALQALQKTLSRQGSLAVRTATGPASAGSSGCGTPTAAGGLRTLPPLSIEATLQGEWGRGIRSCARGGWGPGSSRKLESHCPGGRVATLYCQRYQWPWGQLPLPCRPLACAAASRVQASPSVGPPRLPAPPLASPSKPPPPTACLLWRSMLASPLSGAATPPAAAHPPLWLPTRTTRPTPLPPTPSTGLSPTAGAAAAARATLPRRAAMQPTGRRCHTRQQCTSSPPASHRLALSSPRWGAAADQWGMGMPVQCSGPCRVRGCCPWRVFRCPIVPLMVPS